MWRKLGKTALILSAIVVGLILLFIGSIVVDRLQQRRAYENQQAEERVAYAYAARLRADGDRLASRGEWEDALARYDQAVVYNRGTTPEEKKNLQVIKEHVGEVVWDKEFEARGNPP